MMDLRTFLRISHLRNLYGLTYSQAALLAGLAFGEAE